MSTQDQQADMKKIGVGIVGASPTNPGWAVAAHMPAVQSLPDYELVAVSTSRRESAEQAAKEFGVAAFDNYQDLINHPGVDLVVITVSVPYHYAIARAAIEAGKMVFSEWPLGMTTDEALDLAARANAAGVRTVVGIQARYSPAIQYTRDLVAGGYIGDVLSTTLSGTALIWGPTTLRKFAYTYDVNNSANLIASSVLHAIDGLTSVLGEYDNVTAKLVTRHQEVTVIEDGTTFTPTAPDHATITGTLTSGVLSTILYRGGTSREYDLRWEIIGTKGELILTADFNGNIQNTDLTLKGGQGEEVTLSEMAIPDKYSEAVKVIPEGPGKIGNVGYVYASFAKDIREGTNLTPDFAHAVKRHRLYDSIMTANRTGIAQKVDNSSPQLGEDSHE